MNQNGHLKKGRYNFDKKCEVCKKDYKGTTNQKYCSSLCRNKWTGKSTQYPHLRSGTVGAIQELRASIDLMNKGYEVFRALSPASSCDLLTLKDNKMLKFEVRTSYKDRNGKFTINRYHIKADNLILVAADEIKYLYNFDSRKKESRTT